MVGRERLELYMMLYKSITYMAFCNHVTNPKTDYMT